MFVGRKKELEYLNELYISAFAEFLTLYGRRRIGKTELLRQAFKDVNHIFYSARECTDYEQLTSISEKILGKGRRFEQWEGLFEHIGSVAEKEKIVLILDEFPYMVKGNPGLPSLIQNMWDHQLRYTQLKLIICGSSMSFIEKEILSEKNPLYGRMTGIYKLGELTFDEVRDFFPAYDDEETLMTYGILGGVPHYLLQFSDKNNLKENICGAILNKGRILYSEVDFLLRQELREPQVYYTIIEKIAMGATKLNEIHTKTQIDTGKLSVYLKNLIELGIIEREYPVTEKVKARINPRTGLYRVSTSYFEFWFRFVFPNLSELEEGLAEEIYEDEIEPNLSDYAGKIYEEVCRNLLMKWIRTEKYPYRIKRLGRWWHKQDEIDILGFTKGNYIAGECKWRNQKTGVKVLNALKEKVENNFSTEKVHYYLFSKSGFTQELLDSTDDCVHLIEKFKFTEF